MFFPPCFHSFLPLKKPLWNNGLFIYMELFSERKATYLFPKTFALLCHPNTFSATTFCILILEKPVTVN
jgi:hypothetical protein